MARWFPRDVTVGTRCTVAHNVSAIVMQEMIKIASLPLIPIVVVVGAVLGPGGSVVPRSRNRGYIEYCCS